MEQYLYSRLGLAGFRSAFRQQTKEGSPKFKAGIFGWLPSFGDNRKPFYGLIDGTSFRLTQNYFIRPTRFLFILHGTYSEKGGRVAVTYGFEPESRLLYYWKRLLFVPFVLLSNSINLIPVTDMQWSVILIRFIAINAFLFLVYRYFRWKRRYDRARMEKQFVAALQLYPPQAT